MNIKIQTEKLFEIMLYCIIILKWRSFMKLLRVKASGFKNCCDDFVIDFVANSRKSEEDKEYELQEIANGLYTYNTLAFVGKNASGKTSATDLLDMAYSILSNFRIENKTYDFNNVELTIDFFLEGYLYKYDTVIKNADALGLKGNFTKQIIKRKKYYKSKLRDIYKEDDYMEVEIFGELPSDTSNLFFILKKNKTRAIYFDSFEKGYDTYKLAFLLMNEYKVESSILEKILKIFDENIISLKMLDDHNYELIYAHKKENLSDKELIYKLSSGTTKGILLYIMMASSLKNGFDLIVDEIENHFHKTLVENMISLYKDKNINKKNASLIFTTHYLELLDLFNRQDNIYIARADNKVELLNMYKDFDIRFDLIKSKQFYNDTFKTAVDYESLMDLKRKLKR